MKSIIVIVLAAIFIYLRNYDFAQLSFRRVTPIVTTNSGEIQGLVLKSSEGRDFYSFSGIPYSEPPVGKLRLKPPVKVKKWDGVLHAKKRSPECTQMDFLEQLTGSEDCLYLNIFQPAAAADERSKDGLAVMVWIHGGGFFAGEATDWFYGPQMLMDHDVIMVSLHYRLGPLGFMTMEDEVMVGNLGIRDQIMALEWIRENVGAFGGDPEKITLFGHSAGSISILYHLLSPKSKGLFRGAIAQSGNTYSSYLHLDKRPSAYAKEFAKNFNCNYENNSKEMLKCLQKVPAMDFASLTKYFIQAEYTGPPVWKPNVDGHYASDPVLPDDPNTLFTNGKFNEVPLIIGGNKDEGIVNMAGYLRGDIPFEEVENDWNRLGPLILLNREADEITGEDVEISNKIRKFYLDDKKYSIENMDKIIEMLGDGMFMAGNEWTVRTLTKRSSNPVYYYLYTHRGSFSVIESMVLPMWKLVTKVFAKLFFGADLYNFNLGVSHADESFSLFQVNALPYRILESEGDLATSRHILTLWTNFAKYADPTPPHFDNACKWHAVNSTYHKYLQIEQNMKMDFSEEMLHRLNFWMSIFDRLLEINKHGHSNKTPYAGSEARFKNIKN